MRILPSQSISDDWYNGTLFLLHDKLAREDLKLPLYIMRLMNYSQWLLDSICSYAETNILFWQNWPHWLHQALSDDNFRRNHSCWFRQNHLSDVIMCVMASQFTSLTSVYSSVYSDSDQIKKSKLRVTGLCAGNSPVTSEFPTRMGQ